MDNIAVYIYCYIYHSSSTYLFSVKALNVIVIVMITGSYTSQTTIDVMKFAYD